MHCTDWYFECDNLVLNVNVGFDDQSEGGVL